MKKTKKLLAVILLLALTVTMVPTFTMQAKAAYKTESVTLLVGESLSSSLYNNVKSVSSSNKKVASVKKDPDNSQKAIISAKKAGKATIKIKTKSNGTATYKITVKKASFKVSPQKILPDGSVVYKITNNTSMTFDYLYFEYTLKNQEKEVINDLRTDGSYYNSTSVYDLQPKKSAYATVRPAYGTNATLANCSGKVDLAKYDSLRSLSAKYTDRTKKVTVSAKLDGNDISIKCKNKYSGNVSGIVYVKVFDGDTLVAVKNLEVYLNGSQSKTDTIPISSLTSTYPNLTVKLDSSSFYSKIY